MPYERVYLNFMFVEKKCVLSLMDHFSKWVDLWPMKSTTAEKVVQKLRTNFSCFGLPSMIVTDNGPPFNSENVGLFCQANGIVLQHHSLPYHPQLNGLTERGVQTTKQSLYQSLLEEKTKQLLFQTKLDNVLFKYRNTPTTTTMSTPASLIFSYSTRALFGVQKNKKKSWQQLGRKQKPY